MITLQCKQLKSEHVHKVCMYMYVCMHVHVYTVGSKGSKGSMILHTVVSHVVQGTRFVGRNIQVLETSRSKHI